MKSVINRLLATVLFCLPGFCHGVAETVAASPSDVSVETMATSAPDLDALQAQTFHALDAKNWHQVIFWSDMIIDTWSDLADKQAEFLEASYRAREYVRQIDDTSYERYRPRIDCHKAMAQNHRIFSTPSRAELTLRNFRVTQGAVFVYNGCVKGEQCARRGEKAEVLFYGMPIPA